jgi:hypothetical protein
MSVHTLHLGYKLRDPGAKSSSISSSTPSERSPKRRCSSIATILVREYAVLPPLYRFPRPLTPLPQQLFNLLPHDLFSRNAVVIQLAVPGAVGAVFGPFRIKAAESTRF